MAEENFTLTTIYTEWKKYQDRMASSLAPLTAEQLALRAAPGLRSIGENAAHVIGCRIGWFAFTLGEEPGPEATEVRWDEPGDAMLSAPKLVRGLETTWQMMAERLARWDQHDMQQEFPDEWDGETVMLSRAWIIYHLLEHDIHHGGEISITLGMNGLKSDFTG